MTIPRLSFFIGMILFCSALYPARGLAHGVEGHAAPGGVAVTCRYSTGEAMSYAKIKIYPPEGDQPFQVGNTDAHGRFCFYPHREGPWRLTADDGLGHHLDLTVPVTDLASFAVRPPAPAAPEGRSAKVFLGLAVIFCLTGFFFWLQGLKLARRRSPPPG